MTRATVLLAAMLLPPLGLGCCVTTGQCDCDGGCCGGWGQAYFRGAAPDIVSEPMIVGAPSTAEPPTEQLRMPKADN